MQDAGSWSYAIGNTEDRARLDRIGRQFSQPGHSTKTATAALIASIGGGLVERYAEELRDFDRDVQPDECISIVLATLRGEDPSPHADRFARRDEAYDFLCMIFDEVEIIRQARVRRVNDRWAAGDVRIGDVAFMEAQALGRTVSDVLDEVEGCDSAILDRLPEDLQARLGA